MKCCVIVDGCSTGQYLAPILKRKRYKCIHVQSHSKAYKIEHGGANLRDFMVSYVYDGNFNKLISFLEEYEPEFIIPGSEPGVELANELAFRLNLFPNAPEAGKICRNKYLTHETLKKAGLPYIRQQLVKDLCLALKWAKEHNKWPVVIKPLDSGGADGFYICKDEEDLRISFNSLFGKETIFETSIETVLIQEFIEGEEYVVNTVSYNGHHYIDSIFKYKRKFLSDGHIAYDTSILISPKEFRKINQLQTYTFDALNAFGIKYGATHNEIKMTEKGPILIECNARLMGDSLPPDVITACLGHNQTELTVRSYTNPTKFLEYIKKKIILRKKLMIVYLISKQEGYVKKIKLKNEIKNLSTVVGFCLHPKIGDFLQKTEDLVTSIGTVYLSDTDKKKIDKDQRQIRLLENLGFFEVGENQVIVKLSKSKEVHR